MKINVKIAAFTAAVILIVVIMISYGVFLFERNSRIEEIEEEQKAILQSFVTLSEEMLLVQDELLLFNTMTALKNTYRGVEYLNFYNIKSDRLFFTDRDKSDSAIKYRDIHDLWKDDYVFSAPVYVSKERTGVAQIGFSPEYYERRITEAIRQARNNILRISFAAMLIGLAMALFLAKTITDPIRKLARGARYIGEGKLETAIDIKSRDEIGMLAEEFNEMAEKLADLDRAKDDFVNAVSHELRTPLAAIEGYIDLLVDRGEAVPEEKRKKALNIMKDSSQRLGRFINDVLDMAKIKAGMMEVVKKENKIDELIEETVSLLDSIAGKKDIEIDIEIDEGVSKVLADKERVNQVLTNLLGNALKFTPQGGTVSIGAADEDEEFVRVWGEDTGPGIPEEDMGRIFRQFEQADEARNIDGPKGTGLGLAIAQGIIESHGGRIWVDSVEGSGTVFYFTLEAFKNGEEQ